MTAVPPDPDPQRTPGLEAGGGVPPGTTPPAAAQTSGVTEHQPANPRQLTPRAIAAVIAVVIFALIFVATAAWLVLKIFGAVG